ncbi:MAG: SDR family oxidoreductase [Actinomycetota bacterium]|nr:SDR family oxidoreductase [Actinomycetota bacterium]
MSSVLPQRSFIVGISSDIAADMSLRLLGSGSFVQGTYRTPSAQTEALATKGAELHQLDCSDKDAIASLVSDESIANQWDLLMLAPATMNPIGRFDECVWDEWEDSFALNSTRQFQFIHALIGRRNRAGNPLVFLWSGPGSNGAAVGYSAITAAKIAQIKMCELLAAEYPDTRFVVVGPGWVATKVHRETLAAESRAGANLERTANRLQSPLTTTFDEIWDFFEWVNNQEVSAVSGRNFSIRSDLWGQDALATFLRDNPHAFKLRRANNDWKPGQQATTYEPPTYASPEVP